MRSLTEEEALAYSNNKIKPKKVTVTNKQFIEEISKRMNLYPEDIVTVLHCAMEIVMDYLLFTTRDRSVKVEFDSDLSFTGQYVPAHVSYIGGSKPKAEREIFIDDAISITPALSKRFKEACNDAFVRKMEIFDLDEELTTKKRAEEAKENT